MIPFLKITIFVYIPIVLMSCTGYQNNNNNNVKKDANETLIKANQKLVKTESGQIEDFISRYGWKMNQTGTGLRYMVYKNGSGVKAGKGMIAKINYTVSLLTGELCYSSDTGGPKEFIIGKGMVENGIDEGILFLKTGDRVKFILPSHLAFGLAGDGDKIPAKAVLVYDIELLELK
jgi:FKBP-type peptidyl-prolyl cis-trans isomerase